LFRRLQGDEPALAGPAATQAFRRPISRLAPEEADAVFSEPAGVNPAGGTPRNWASAAPLSDDERCADLPSGRRVEADLVRPMILELDLEASRDAGEPIVMLRRLGRLV
jgi:hypothetical protein